MRGSKYIFILLAVAMLSACTIPLKNDQYGVVHGEHFEILDVLPRNIEGFSYLGSSIYPDPWGYSLRYMYDANHRVYSDIYIYPVPKEAVKYSQKEIVDGMTELALREIDYAKAKGAYSEFEIIGKNAFDIQGEYGARADIYLVKDNLVSYSLLFLTERDGKLIKARMTMPDNEPHRNSEVWQRFIDKAFLVILNNIEKA